MTARVCAGLAALAGFSLFAAYVQTDIMGGQYWQLALMNGASVLVLLAIVLLTWRAVFGV